MIVLKILLWIFLAVLALILLIMILPVSVKVGYVDKKVSLKVKYAFINLFELGGKGLLNRFMGGGKKKNIPPEPVRECEKSAEKTGSSETADESVGSTAEKAESPGTAEEAVSARETPEAAPDKRDEVTEDVRENTESVGEGAEKAETKSDIPDENDSSSEEEKSEKEKGGKSLTEKIDFFHDIWHAAGRPALKIFKGFKFSEFYVDFLIANQDAYKCALNYGRISGALYYVLGWFGVLFNMKYKTVDVNPGFDMKESRWDVSFKLSFNIMNVVVAGLWFLMTYIFRILIPSKRMKKKMKKAAMQK